MFLKIIKSYIERDIGTSRITTRWKIQLRIKLADDGWERETERYRQTDRETERPGDQETESERPRRQRE